MRGRKMLKRKFYLIALYVGAFNLMLRLLFRLARKGTSDTKVKTIYFDLKEINYFNYYISIFRALSCAGYRVVMRPRISVLANSGNFGRYLQKIEKFSLGWALFKKPHMTVIDYDVLNPGNYVSLNSRFFTGSSSKKMQSIIPFPMSPNTLLSSEGCNLANLRLNGKSREVFFSGNVDRRSYGNNLLEQYFGIRNRYDIVMNFFVNQNSINEDHEFNKILLNICYWEGLSTGPKTLRTRNEDWLSILSTKMFSLCPPGVQMPFCYNLIESLAVGTIPILEYGHLLPITLEHKVNCIDLRQYSTVENLVNDLGSMEESELAQMKKNVIQYYDEYLSFEVTANMIYNSAGETLYFINTPDAEKKLNEWKLQ